MTKKQRAAEAVRLLKEAYPDAVCSLTYQKPHELLIAVRLSAQCTDARVNLVCETLFEKQQDAAAGPQLTDRSLLSLERIVDFADSLCPEDVPRSYHNMVNGQMAEILTIAESAPTGVLYFCNAGKDRTGVLSALLLRRMGASRQEIIDNYLITAENLREMLAEFVAKRPELSLNVVMPRAWYMEMFLDDMDNMERTFGKEISKWNQAL